MRWWHFAGIVAVLAIALIIASQPAGPKMNETNAPVVQKEVKILVFDENGNEINAHVWRKGIYWCAEGDGFLSDCAREENGIVRITLMRDPAEKDVRVELKNCAFMAYAPVGVPLTGPVPCGEIKMRPGRYVFAFFDGNGAIIGRKEVFIEGERGIEAEGNTTGTPVRIRTFDEGTGKEMNAWVSFEGIALWGEDVPVNVKNCETIHAWAEGHKIMDAYVCPGDEENVTLPRQVNGGTLIVSAPGAERIIITDRNASVYTVVSGEEASLTDVPPGVYTVFAVNGAAVSKKTVDVDAGQRIISIEGIRGRATIETEKRVQIFAMGEKIAEGSGKIEVPARTILHVVILENPPREERVVLLPGEVRTV